MYSKISSMIDTIANKLEGRGLIKEAFELYKISDVLDKQPLFQDDIDSSINVTPEARKYIEEIKKQIGKYIGNPKVRVKIEKGSYKNSFEVSVLSITSVPSNIPPFTSDSWDDVTPGSIGDKYKDTKEETTLFSVLIDGGSPFLSSPRPQIKELYGKFGRFIDYHLLDKLWSLLSGIEISDNGVSNQVGFNAKESPAVVNKPSMTRKPPFVKSTDTEGGYW